MFRGSILCAALLGSGSAQPGHCGDCNLNLTALEEFTADYDVVLAQMLPSDHGPPPLTTMALPPMLPSDHGTIAVHARNLQLKLDNHLAIPENLPNPRQKLNPIISMLAGHEIHEELHINGVSGQASYHLGSPVFNACIQVDLPPPRINHEMLEMHLEQAQSIATMVVQREGAHVTVDDVPGVVIPIGRSGTIFVFTDDSHPEMVAIDRTIRPGEIVGLKFSNYKNSVGQAFSVRACEVEAHTATQTMMAENPGVQDFFAQRLAEHETRLQALLEPTWLNTRYNFIPLQVADLMLAPSPKGCADNVLAETAPMASNTLQSLALGVCSFAMGITATYGAMRKRAAPSDAYYQVSA